MWVLNTQKDKTEEKASNRFLANEQVTENKTKQNKKTDLTYKDQLYFMIFFFFFFTFGLSVYVLH